MQEQEITFREMFAFIARKWRGILAFAIIAALLTGGAVAGWRIWWHCNADKYTQDDVAPSFVEKRLAEKALLMEQLSDTETTLSANRAKINAAHSMIEGKKTQNEQLNSFVAAEEEQIQRSIYMSIDPYQIQASDRYFRVNTDYQILPSMTYQNPDRTAEIINTYIVSVSNEEVFNQMIKDLKLTDISATEIREIVSVFQCNSSSFKVHVIGTESELTTRIADYMASTILSAQNFVASTVAAHTVVTYGNTDYLDANTGVQETQQSRWNALTDAKETAYQNETDVLNAETEIAKLREENRSLEKNLKLQKAELAGFDFTPVSFFTGFVKFAIFGGVAAVFLAAVILLMLELMSEHVMSPAQCSALVPGTFFGRWPENRKRTVIGKVGDHWAAQLEGTVSGNMTDANARELVLSNLEQVLHGFTGELLLCGGATVAEIEEIRKALQEKYPELKICCGGDIAYDPNTVRALPVCNGVVLVEKNGKSQRSNIYAFRQRADALGKPIFGFILT